MLVQPGEGRRSRRARYNGTQERLHSVHCVSVVSGCVAVEQPNRREGMVCRSAALISNDGGYI